MSDAFVGFVPFDGARVGPLGEEGPVVGRDGVTDGVTFKGRAVEDGGGMVGPVRGAQRRSERRVGYERIPHRSAAR